MPSRPRTVARRRASEPALPHRRDAAATRAAILDAARRHFARAGYDHVGVREIAADAGVTAALVNRYFGSKAQLFAEVLASGFDIAPLLPEDRARFGAVLGRYIAAAPRRTPDDQGPLSLLLRSAASPTAGELLREHIDTHLVEPLAKWIGGEDAELRATLIVATLAGLGVLRRLVKTSALAGVDESRLGELLGELLDAELAPR